MDGQKQQYRKKCDTIAGAYGRMSRESRGLVYSWENKYRPLFARYIGQGMQVLDMGGGTGAFTNFVGGLGATVVCSDISLGMLQEASHIGIHKKVQADSERLPFKPGSMDAVVTVSSLAYVPDKRSCLAEVYQLLKPGGVLLVLDMNPDFIKYSFIRDARQRKTRAEMRHASFAPMLQDAGFRILEWGRFNWVLHKSNGLVFYLCRMADMCLRFLNPWSTRIYYVAKK